MILKNVYFREINIQSGTWEEFKNQLGTALDMLSHATEDSYERMNIAAFTDWAKDLNWIKEDNIIIKVNGPVTKIVEEVMKEQQERNGLPPAHPALNEDNNAG